MRPTLARRCRARSRRPWVVGEHQVRSARRRDSSQSSRRPEPRSCGRRRGSGSPWTTMSAVGQPRPRCSTSSNAFRRHRAEVDLVPVARAGGRSRSPARGAAAEPESTDATRGACRPRDASRPPSRWSALQVVDTTTPPANSGRPVVGIGTGHLHGRGAGGAQPPTRSASLLAPR